MRRISVIMAVYNALEYTKLCIDYLQKCLSGYEAEIIVVDNASSDGTGEFLTSQKHIKVISHQEPVSVAAAYNQALSAATGEMMLFMHNDVLLPPYTIQLLEEALYSDEKLGAVGPSAVSPEVYRMMAPPDELERYSSLEGMLTAAEKLHEVSLNSRPAFVLSNICVLCKREALAAVGQWDEQFLLHYFEDIDYFYRMQLAGWALQVIPNVYVHHFSGATYAENKIDAKEAWSMFSDVFRDKWKFKFEYSSFVRSELLKFVDVAQDKLAVLDIGCAMGGNFCYIKSRNPQAELCGIELDPASACIAKGFADVRNNNIEKYSIPEWEGKFDYVIMGDVIEHLINPWGALRKVGEMLKPGGRIIASIPNVLHISVLQSLLQGNFTYEDAGILDRTHMRFYTKREMLKLFETTGYNAEVIGRSSVIDLSHGDNEYVSLAQGLLKLPEVSIDLAELEAYQWFIKATKR